jgi:peptide/nickel transport system permease protein
MSDQPLSVAKASANTQLIPELSRDADSYWRRSLRVFARQPGNLIALLVIVAGLVLAVMPHAWLPFDPTAIDLAERLHPPSWSLDLQTYILGTDVMGRDILTRMIFAARWTYLVAVSAVAISAILGTLTGLLTGFFGGTLDAVLSRIMDMQLAFPVVLLALGILAVAGPSLVNMILVLGLVDWARYARVIRGATLSIRERDFVEAATSVGASNPRIVFRHILPNVLSPILVLTTFSAARLMLTESALSFLGLGVTPPATTWGGMIGAGRDYLYRASWTSVIPGLVITLTVLAINIVGDGLRDAFDPQGEER